MLCCVIFEFAGGLLLGMQGYAGVWSERGGFANTPVPQFDGLLQQRLSTACRYKSSTTKTARESSRYSVTHNAVGLVEPLTVIYLIL